MECYVHYFVAVVCIAVGVSVVRESTQGAAAGDKDQDVMSLPQLTQEGQFNCVTSHNSFTQLNLKQTFLEFFSPRYIKGNHTFAIISTAVCYLC